MWEFIEDNQILCIAIAGLVACVIAVLIFNP